MSKLASLLAIALVVLCGCESRYKSSYEAEEACYKWEKQGMKYTRKYQDYVDGRYQSGESKRNTRRCSHEEETKQYLGIENTAITKKVYERSETPPRAREVTAHFKY